MNFKIVILPLLLLGQTIYSQSAKDFFKQETKINWLGVDFSHSKIIGEFSQFAGAGKKGVGEIQSVYIPAWNKLFVNEMEKYDLKKFLRKDNVYIEIDAIMTKNADTPTESLEGYNQPNYPTDSIASFIKETDLPIKNEIGALLITDYLHKGIEEAGFHFVVVDLSTKNVLFSKYLKCYPRGFGMRNYWAGAIYDALKKIDSDYKSWSKSYR
jgi:hypothetical protein